MNLRKKVFTAFVGFIVVPLFVLGVITYLVSQHIIEKNFAEQSEFTLKAVGRNITYMLKEANYFSDVNLLQQDIQDALAEKERIELIDIAANIRTLQRTFLAYAPAYSVALYNFRGQGFGDGKIGHSLMPYEALIRHPVYPEVRRLNGLSKWIGPHEYPELTGDNGLFTQIRVVNDKYTLDNKGILIQQLQFQELDKIFNFFGTGARKDVRFMIVGRDGVVMVDNKKKLDGRSIFDQTAGRIDLASEYASGKMDFDGVESVVSVHHLELSDLGSMNWTLVSVTPWDVLSGSTVVVVRWIAAITTLSLVCALLFNLLFVNRNIRFILKVVSSMKRVEIGDLDIRVLTKGTDETAVLARGFNSLVARIGTLLEEVKREQQRKNKAELMLLQAQIKPHFIFNTLESINALAVQNEGRKVSQLVHRLGTILRISFTAREEIPLRLEIDHLRNYLQIQSYRFENLFDYDIDVPDHLGRFSILKLTLQPLVENSIQHGFDGMERGGRLVVRAEEREDRIVLYVEDNGKGIPHRTLSRFHAKTEEPCGEPHRQTAEDGGAAIERIGLGLPNVADRIRIQYGARYGLFVCSEEGKGTIIQITIPKYEAG
ncbi:cache domain-containing sensor histidine kinase [Paenibacillus flagellatus]|uniref:histidine kinase n=1 Tax=Paenibacillus flagellatus TaxID=2211139 RepID=A0A2V5K3P3_9BACL|nr:sensor histidine kinase [Paenibacillus flagellatus]PYI53895.1 two-component sensor histidine kinase [Paenibacillus flagellatus]